MFSQKKSSNEKGRTTERFKPKNSFRFFFKF